MNRSIVLLCVWSLLYSTSAQSYMEHKNLVENVLVGYNPDIIPLYDLTDTMNITVRATLYSLLDVDVVKGKISVLMTLTCDWIDSQITWIPSEYGNISEISFLRKKVWSPSFILGSPVDFTTVGHSDMTVLFSNYGDASMTLGDVINSGCTFDMKFWPFDKQTCDLSFAAFGFDMDHVRLKTRSDRSFTSFLLNENIEWDLLNAEIFVREDRGLSEAVLRLNIKRRSDIFIILIIFPLYGLSSLNSMVFLLPSESGERIGFSATIMLSITVFLEVISDYIPNTSKPMPLLCIMVTVVISTSILCIMTVIVSLHFFHKDDDEPVKGCIQNFVKLFNKKYRGSRVESKNTVEIKDDYIHRLNRDLKMKDFQVSEELKEKKAANLFDKRITWTDVSQTIDTVCFVTVTVAYAIVMVGFTLYLTYGSE